MLSCEGKNAESIGRYLAAKGWAEPESYAGGQTYMRITENNLTDVTTIEDALLEQILSPYNLNRA